MPEQHSKIQDIGKYYNVFSVETVSEAPETTGLYAWYADLNAGLKDWELEIVDGIDAGTERLRKLLRRHTECYSYRELDTKALGSFSQTWSGQLQDQTADILRDVLTKPEKIKNQDNYDFKRAPKLQSTLESRNARSLMVKALETAIPILSAPIYVGVAECLQARLSQHVKELTKLADTVVKDPSSRQRLRGVKKTNFALRTIAAGFAPENLQVWTFNLELLIDDIGNTNQDPRAVSEAIEWVLNRWHRPYLGRR